MAKTPPSPISMCKVILRLTDIAIHQENQNHREILARLKETKRAITIIKRREEKINRIRNGRP
jgi:hypothetical protein